MAHHVEGARLVVQNLRDVLADLAQAAAAGRATAPALRGMNDGASRQVGWQVAQARSGLEIPLCGAIDAPSLGVPGLKMMAWCTTG